MFATAHTTAGEIGGHALKHAETEVLRTGQGVSNGIQEIMAQNAQHLIKKKQVHVPGDAVLLIAPGSNGESGQTALISVELQMCSAQEK